MKMNQWLGVLIVAACAGSGGLAQQTPYRPGYQPPTPTNKDAAAEVPFTATVADRGALSDWIVYRRDCCEGKHGIVTPFYTELYLRAGPSLPVGGTTLSRELSVGWSIAGGARALFFNEPHTRAWAVDVHVINTNESGRSDPTEFPVTIFHAGTRLDFGTGGTPGVTVRRSNRTMFGLGLGREWYPWQPADHDGCKWRFGLDFGGRYGSHRLDLHETRNITDVVGAMYAAASTDIEWPWHETMVHVGLRFEWAFTWSDVLQRTSDVQDLNVLLSTGIRY